MRPIQTLVLALLAGASAGAIVAQGALAQDIAVAAEPPQEADVVIVEVEAAVSGPFEAGDLTLADFHWKNRILVVFADSAQDPSFLRQLELLALQPGALDDRDVVVLTDVDPAARGAIRTKLRPRGFSAVLVDKDGRVIARRPAPWDLREIQRTIDSTPLRLQELNERRDAIAPIRGGR